MWRLCACCPSKYAHLQEIKYQISGICPRFVHLEKSGGQNYLFATMDSNTSTAVLAIFSVL